MLEKWTGALVSQMHLNRIKGRDLAKQLGYREEYVSAVLNGRRNPHGAELKFRKALEELIAEREH